LSAKFIVAMKQKNRALSSGAFAYLVCREIT